MAGRDGIAGAAIFANALFQQQVPFGRGRIILEGTDTALSINVYTTQGILVPGVISKGTEMKIVFRSLAYQGSLTQSIMTRDLWISKNAEFITVFKLERMARSLARSKKN